MPTTARNPKPVLYWNMLYMQELDKRSFTKDDPWKEALASTVWAICSTYHTMLGTTLGQLVCDRDMLHDSKHVVD
eukprot:409910-Ditylum_brightwellii.AAC.1